MYFSKELKKNNVSTVVRVCEPSYETEELESQGISVRDLRMYFWYLLHLHISLNLINFIA